MQQHILLSKALKARFPEHELLEWCKTHLITDDRFLAYDENKQLKPVCPEAHTSNDILLIPEAVYKGVLVTIIPILAKNGNKILIYSLKDRHSMHILKDGHSRGKPSVP
jgi:hypothetical protein